jgi:hypothetical protein
MSFHIFDKQSDEDLHFTNSVLRHPLAGTQGTTEKYIFRISGIPLNWTEDDVLDALKSVDATRTLAIQKCHVALYPACYGSFQTGLLNTDSSLQQFSAIDEDGDGVVLELSTQDIVHDLFIDRHFYDLTPLNTPRNDVFAE